MSHIAESLFQEMRMCDGLAMTLELTYRYSR